MRDRNVQRERPDAAVLPVHERRYLRAPAAQPAFSFSLCSVFSFFLMFLFFVFFFSLFFRAHVLEEAIRKDQDCSAEN